MIRHEKLLSVVILLLLLLIIIIITIIVIIIIIIIIIIIKLQLEGWTNLENSIILSSLWMVEILDFRFWYFLSTS